MSDQVSYLNDEDARVPRLTRAALQEAIDEQIELLAGNIPKGIEDYRYRTGMIAGLRAAMEICQNIEKKIGG